MKPCPFCAEEIQDEAVVCRHCGATLTPAAMPAATGDLPPSYGSTGVTFSHTGTRWLLGYGPDFYGIWDRQNPGPPTQRFPRTESGWLVAWQAFRQMEPSATPTPDVGTYHPSRQETNGMAVAALVTGILFIPIVPIVLGHVSKSEIDRSGGAQTGRGMAIAGLVLGWVWLAFLLLVIVVALVFGLTFGTKVLNQEINAQSDLRNATAAAQTYYAQHRSSYGGLTARDLHDLAPSIVFNNYMTTVSGQVSVRDAAGQHLVLVSRTGFGLVHCVGLQGAVASYGRVDAQTATECTGGW